MTDATGRTVHRAAWLEVDLDAIAANVGTIRALVGPGVRVAPVVKADAYGHGLVPVGRALAPVADALCVATLDEALALRSAGVDCRLILLYPVPPGAVPDAIQAGVELTVMSARDAAAIAGAGQGRAAPRVHLAVDTGMTRGGIRPEEAPVVARDLAIADVPIAGTWTHQCCPEDPARSVQQVERFELAVRALGAEGIAPGERHVASSGGIFAAAAPGYDLVRPGLATYGLLGDDLPLADERAEAAAQLRPALALKAQAIAIDEVRPGTTVGYGATWSATRPSRIATLPVGYADGYARGTQPGASVIVRGTRAPVVGIVSMDAIAVDVTDVPGVDAEDEFVLLGQQGDERIGAGDLARRRNTIAWEVLSGMAARLDRVYHPATAAGRSRVTTDGPHGQPP